MTLSSSLLCHVLRVNRCCTFMTNCITCRYLPILPMVLVNGAEGIGTGWSTSIPNYNPLDVISNTRKLLDDEEPEEMTPWYRFYQGDIYEIPAARNATSKSFQVSGIVEQVCPCAPFRTSGHSQPVAWSSGHTHGESTAIVTSSGPDATVSCSCGVVNTEWVYDCAGCRW